MQVVSGRLDRPVLHFTAPPRDVIENELSVFLISLMQVIMIDMQTLLFVLLSLICGLLPYTRLKMVTGVLRVLLQI